MKKNSIIIKNFLEKMIFVGGIIASKNYMIIVLSNALNEQKKRYPFIECINVGEIVYIDDKIDSYNRAEILDPINKVFDYLFLDSSKKLLKENIDPVTYAEFKNFGLHI